MKEGYGQIHHTFASLSGVIKWKQSENSYIALRDMSPSHILNALNHMEVVFFTHFTSDFSDNWGELIENISVEFPIYKHMVNEALGRKNPWRNKEDSEARDCLSLLETYFILKREEDPPDSVVKESEELHGTS